MIIYKPGDMDVVMAQAWATMSADTGLEKVFYIPPTLSVFLAHLQSCPVVLFDLDEQNAVWYLVWFERFFSSGLFSMWIRADRRGLGQGSERGRAAFLEAAKLGFSLYNNRFFSYTSQPAVHAALEHIGFSEVCTLPNIWHGQDQWLMVLESSTMFEESA